jgi:coenzyme F420-reducing hydrogenase delta subunit
MIFVKNSLDLKVDMLNKVKKLFSYEVKRGYAGNLGNKGAIVCGFKVCDTVVASYACHLAAGDEKSQERLEDVRGILKSVGENEEARKYMGLIDYEIFAGDLNFRLNTQDQTVRQILS